MDEVFGNPVLSALPDKDGRAVPFDLADVMDMIVGESVVFVGVLGAGAVASENHGRAAEVVEQSSHSFTFRALGDGPITARLVHAETGESLDAVVVEASTVQNVVVAEAKAGRDYLVGGCLEWVGVHVETPVGRGFDLDLLLTVDGDAQAEMWDCYRVDVPTGVDHLDLEVLVAGEVHMRTMPVVEGDCL